MENQRSQPPLGGTSGSTGRRLHIAHRRSPSELTPLMSMFTSPGMEQLAIQQQIDLLRQQQQQIQATHQQYVNMGMIPASQQLIQGNNFNSLQQQQIQNLPQSKFQYPNHIQQAQINTSMGPPTQPLSHRRNQSALPNMGMGPPPAPSSGSSIIGYNDFSVINRENNPNKASHTGGPQGGGHQRRHSLALPEAIKAAELAQQKRTTSGFQFPVPDDSKDNQGTEEQADQVQGPNDNYTSNSKTKNGRIAHGRSQSVAAGADLRRGQAMRGSNAFQFPMTTPQEANNVGQGNDFQRRGSYAGHNRSSSRNFEGNWRNQPSPSQSPQETQAINSFQAQPQQGGFQPGHRARASMGQSISATLNSFQFGAQPHLVQLPQGQMALVSQPIYSAQQLNPMQMNQFQAMQATQINGHMNHGSNQLNQLTSTQQQQQRKTLFTPYLPQASLPALLGDGQLVSGILRVNKKNRSDAYVTTQDGLLDADIFICGSKDRNRALEGDLVAVELLDVDEVWGQKREKEEKKKRKDITDGRVGSISNIASSYKEDEEPAANESGLRRRGSLKQRPTQKKNDDVEVEGQSLLLVEEEEVNDEQKPLYAGHIVAVIERVPGQMFSGTLGLLRPSSQATREKQEAERQAREMGSGRYYEQRQQDKPKIVWFKPTDKRVPLIAIPTEQAPRDFIEKHQDYADRIFVASIKRWPITSLHPFGTLVEQLGKMGEIKVETEALLRDNNFASDEFSDAVLRSVNLHNWSQELKDTNIIKDRRDFRGEKVFTIDLNGTNEFDNAIHIKKDNDGSIEIGIHISDVTHFVKANSLVDREAKRRGTAVYLMNRSCAMLHPKIATQICSLIPGEDRFTISLIFKVKTDNLSLLTDEVWIGKSIINSTGKLSYAEVNTVLSGHPTAKLNEIEIEQIKILHAVAQNWRGIRLKTNEEAVPLRLIYQLDDENVKVEQNIFNSSPSHELFEELMIKTNFYVAQRLFKDLPEKALLRRQGPPNTQRLQAFSDRMCKIFPEIDITSSESLQNSLCKVEDADVRKGMETLLVKTMHRAKYCISGRTPAHLYPHYALNLPLYTHFTSPLRRYADLVVHRQLDAILSEGKICYNEDIENLVKTASSCNTKKDSAHNAQEQSIHIESCRNMDRKCEEAGGELISEGIVICVHESAFDVLIPQYGFEKRVHCDQIPLKKAEFRKDDRVLELYWEKGVSSSTYIPEDERLKVGTTQHAAYAAAAAKQAAVAERAKKEHEEAQRKNMETGTISTDDVDALFDDDDDISDAAEGLSGVSLIERPTQSVPPSPKNSLHTFDTLHRTQSDSRVHTTEASVTAESAQATETVETAEIDVTTETTQIDETIKTAKTKISVKEKYFKLFSLREENGEYIQDVKELMRVPVILKTDLTKSPPCLTIRSLNPYAL
ncbi:Virulence protein SSD1 [Erysiphe necator]|uniref:Putative rnb domain-containing protein n=1 Tax=Uncinula necator TaxID=52586 RepID=A0A0B1PB55_UNCNE|nr:Virulence protein SSD1 [Erysiphe necator]KHJ33874.1 putative rnb domain-containing protein [Erysiphe necator]